MLILIYTLYFFNPVDLGDGGIVFYQKGTWIILYGNTLNYIYTLLVLSQPHDLGTFFCIHMSGIFNTQGIWE